MKQYVEEILFGEEKHFTKKQKQGMLLLAICLAVGVAAGVFAWKEYQATAKWEFPDGSLMGYEEIIFVGDSRTVQMEEKSDNPQFKFIGKNGGGLRWFKNEGYAMLTERLSGKDSPRPTAVVFNFGVNDYRYHTPAKYIQYFKKIAGELKDRNCYLFYMSVNPVEEEKIRAEGKSTIRTNEKIEEFNRKLKAGLKEDYVWLDLYGELKERGCATRDGLHFTGANSVYILNRSVQLLLATGAYPQKYFWCERGGYWYAIRWSDNRRLKGWIQDGEGSFCLDEKGRLLQNHRMEYKDGKTYLLGPTGRKEAAEFQEDPEAV